MKLWRCAALVLVAACGARESSPPDFSRLLRFETVRTGQSREELRFSAELRTSPQAHHQVTTKRAGTVLEIAAVGSTVTTADVIARLKPLRAMAPATVASLATARAETARLERLARLGLIASHQAVVSARELQTLEAGLKQAEAPFTIVADHSGTVLEQLVDAGAVVSAGSAIAVIGEPLPFEVVARVPPPLAAQVRDAEAVAVRLPFLSSEAFAASVVDHQTAVTDNHNLEFRFRVDSDFFPIGASPGATAIVSVMSPARSVLLVPGSALIWYDHRNWVVVKKDGKYSARPVAVKLRDDSDVEIVSGLAVGESVVTDGKELVFVANTIEPAETSTWTIAPRPSVPRMERSVLIDARRAAAAGIVLDDILDQLTSATTKLEPLAGVTVTETRAGAIPRRWSSVDPEPHEISARQTTRESTPAPPGEETLETEQDRAVSPWAVALGLLACLVVSPSLRLAALLATTPTLLSYTHLAPLTTLAAATAVSSLALCAAARSLALAPSFGWRDPLRDATTLVFTCWPPIAVLAVVVDPLRTALLGLGLGLVLAVTLTLALLMLARSMPSTTAFDEGAIVRLRLTTLLALAPVLAIASWLAIPAPNCYATVSLEVGDLNPGFVDRLLDQLAGHALRRGATTVLALPQTPSRVAVMIEDAYADRLAADLVATLPTQLLTARPKYTLIHDVFAPEGTHIREATLTAVAELSAGALVRDGVVARLSDRGDAGLLKLRDGPGERWAKELRLRSRPVVVFVRSPPPHRKTPSETPSRSVVAVALTIVATLLGTWWLAGRSGASGRLAWLSARKLAQDSALAIAATLPLATASAAPQVAFATSLIGFAGIRGCMALIDSHLAKR